MSMAETLMTQDWEPFIQSMVQKVHTPQLNLQTEKIKTVQGQLTELTTLERHLSEFHRLFRTLKDGDFFNGRTSSITQGESVHVTVANSTPVGKYRVDVQKLATASQRLGNTRICNALLPSCDTTTRLGDLHLPTTLKEGFFTVNGHQISVESNDTVQDLWDKLAEAGVTATYDEVEDRITLTAEEPIYLGAANDTSNLLNLLRLYTNGTNSVASLTRTCAINLERAISSENLKTPVTSDGVFKLNGVAIEYKASDSIQQIMANINGSNAGVYINYTPSTQSFTLTAKATGSLGISLEDVEGNFLEALGLKDSALTLGENASFTINGGEPLICTSNTFSDNEHGIHGLTIQSEQLGVTEFTVSAEETKSVEAAQRLVSKYNEVLDYLQKQTEADPKNKKFGAFHNNSEIKSFMRTFRSVLIGFVKDESGRSDFEKLSAIGYTFDGSHHLSLNTDTFISKLKTAPEEITSVFSAMSTSPIAKAESFLNTFLENNFKVVRKTYTAQQEVLQRKLQQMERQFSMQEESWRKTFDKVRELNSRMYAQMQAVNSLGKNS